MLDGYQNYIGNKGTSLKSGCGFYIKNSLKYIERKDLNVNIADGNNEYQSFWIEIFNKNSSNIVVGVFYRHPKPNSDSKLCDDLSATVKKLINNNKLCILTGDFN